MSTSKLSIIAAISVLIGMAGCSDILVSPSDDVPESSAVNEAAPLSKQGKVFVELPFGPQTSSFVNPCTELPDEVTIVGTLWIFERSDGRFVGRAENVVTTQSGFEGLQRVTILWNGNNFKFSLNSMGTNAIGQRIRIRSVQVIDGLFDPTKPATVRVLIQPEPVCVHQ